MNWSDKTASRPVKYIALHFELEQLILQPTRICDTCSSILDNIFTNKLEKYKAHSVLQLAISDNYLTFAVRKIKNS